MLESNIYGAWSELAIRYFGFLLQNHQWWSTEEVLWNREPDAPTSVNDGGVDSTTGLDDKRSMWI